MLKCRFSTFPACICDSTENFTCLKCETKVKDPDYRVWLKTNNNNKQKGKTSGQNILLIWGQTAK